MEGADAVPPEGPLTSLIEQGWGTRSHIVSVIHAHAHTHARVHASTGELKEGVGAAAVCGTPVLIRKTKIRWKLGGRLGSFRYDSGTPHVPQTDKASSRRQATSIIEISTEAGTLLPVPVFAAVGLTDPQRTRAGRGVAGGPAAGLRARTGARADPRVVWRENGLGARRRHA